MRPHHAAQGRAAGSRSARLLEGFLNNKQRFLATTLVGSQLSVVVSTVVMTYALHHRFRPSAPSSTSSPA